VPIQLLLKCLLLSAAVLTSLSTTASEVSFGLEEDLRFATQLWQRMETAKMVGPRATAQEPFFGGAKPHGMILELAFQLLDVESHEGFVVVKKNYDGNNVSVEAVKKNRAAYLVSYTVMFQRAAGYDTQNNNWFWVKYDKKGKLMQKVVNGNVLSIAGRVAKGETPEENGGCIYCHSSAGGGDYIFYPQIQLPGFRP